MSERVEGIIKIIVAVLLLLISIALGKYELLSLIIVLIAYLICGYNVIIDAFNCIIHREGLDERMLMTIATIGAFILGEKYEALAVMVFYLIGELFEDYSMDKSRDAIKALASVAPNFANVYNNGNIIKIDSERVKIGDIVVVNPYEKIPVDGEIIEGETVLNTSMLTGESIPRYVKVGDFVNSGLINNDKVIKIKTLKEFKDSTATKIVKLIEEASDKKSKSEHFIRNFARVYTPIICLIAVITFIIPVLYQYIVLKMTPQFSIWLYRALTILVISCPCAIIISVPLAFFASIGLASKNGILIKGSNYIEALSRIKTFAFDKTGTMTKGVFQVIGAHHLKIEEDELFRYVAHLEFSSNHPIAKSIVKYYAKPIDMSIVKDVKEIGGRGLSGIVDDRLVLAGNDKLMEDNNIEFIKCSHAGTIVHVAIDNTYVGHILISDVIKDNAKKAISMLKNLGVTTAIMLTGDREKVASEVASELGIDEYHANLLPDEKLEIVKKKMETSKLAFVGDGINDAACVTYSDVGIAMGLVGSDSVIDLSDIVVMDDDILNIVKTYILSKKTMTVVYENVIISLGIKLLVLLLSLFGISNMWLAVFSDVGIMILAVLNSIRLLYSKIEIR